MWHTVPMKRAWILVLLLAVAACSRSKAPTTADAAPPSAVVVSEGAQVPAVPLSMRSADYDRQHALTLPPPFPAEGRALVPPFPHKLVAWGLELNMALTKPSPGRRKLMVRLATLQAPADLLKALHAHLVAQGWSAPDPELRAPLQHATHGRLLVSVTQEAEQATRVELVIEGTQPAEMPLENPLVFLRTPRDWLSDTEMTVVGYELAHYHAVHFAGAQSDLQRVAVQVRLADEGAREALLMRLPDRVEQAGFRMEARESGLYRGADGGIFVVRPAEDAREVIIHHQQRWKRP